VGDILRISRVTFSVLPWSLSLVMFAAAGCQSLAGNPCTPGRTVSCACTDGRAGAQACQANGTFSACVCTGAAPAGKTTAPAKSNRQKFETVSVGYSHACALREDGIVKCWGNNYLGKASPPDYEFSQVVAGVGHTCALGRWENGWNVTCWGDISEEEGPLPAPRLSWREPNFVHLGETGNNLHACGVHSDGALECWGSKRLLRTSLREMPLPQGKFIQVSGGWPGCGLKANGTVTCWGSGCRQKDGKISPSCSPDGTFRQISGGLPNGCGIMANGTVKCWGTDEIKRHVPKAGAFSYVSNDFQTACAIRSDTGDLVCWGEASPLTARTPAGTFKKVSVGISFACAVRTDGSIACWGRNDFGQSAPPE
jgi:alpha-tubulin suppressor-like RCC1 family protein